MRRASERRVVSAGVYAGGRCRGRQQRQRTDLWVEAGLSGRDGIERERAGGRRRTRGQASAERADTRGEPTRR